MDTQHEHATPQNDRKHGATPAATVNEPDAHETERMLAARLAAMADKLERLADQLEGKVTK